MKNLPQVPIGGLRVSRLIVGGNPFSGVSHADGAKSDAMRRYFTVARIKQTLADCEFAGINTFNGRCDNHICRMLMEYYAEGGRIQWLAQTAPEHRDLKANIRLAAFYGAKGCYIQGAQVAGMIDAGHFDEIASALALIRELGMVAGVAGHDPKYHLALTDRGVIPDFHMVCFYNVGGHKGNITQAAHGEQFLAQDREAAVQAVQELKAPAIGYKIMAAGRNDPEEAYRFAYKRLRPGDAACVGFFPKDNPDQIRDSVRLTLQAIAEAQTSA